MAVRSGNGPGGWGGEFFFVGPPNDFVALGHSTNISTVDLAISSNMAFWISP